MLIFAIIENNKVKKIIKTNESYETSMQVLPLMLEGNKYKIIQINKEIQKKLKYDSYYADGIFYDPQPYPSWILNEGNWCAPVNIPNDGRVYCWQEEIKNWQPF